MKKETSYVLGALLLGAAAGGVAALLLAPASGADTRKKIGDTLRRTKDKAFKGMEEAKDFAESHRDAIKEAVIGGKEAYQKVMKRGSAEATT